MFGDPEPDKDPVELGMYKAGDGYPRFDVDEEDLLLPYCTEGYNRYSMSVPGIGKVTRASGTTIEYEWTQLPNPIPRGKLLESLDDNERRKMNQLGIKAHRVIELTAESFANATQGLL